MKSISAKKHGNSCFYKEIGGTEITAVLREGSSCLFFHTVLYTILYNSRYPMDKPEEKEGFTKI
jgi:hypothetical protein